jgi:hypothetical protein
MNRREEIKNWFAKQVEEDLTDDIPEVERPASIFIVVLCSLLLLYYVLHQIWSTGFFTASFGILEAVFLYGSLTYWIATSALLLLGFKNASRDLDSFGGLIFATIGISWLLLVFPHEFAYFADVLPEFLRFLLRWISNDVARVIMVLLIVVHLIFAVVSFTIRVQVWRERSRS